MYIIGEMERRIKATLFGWKPGTSPVIVSNITPSIEQQIVIVMLRMSPSSYNQ